MIKPNNQGRPLRLALGAAAVFLASREVAERFKALREVLVQRDPAGLTPLLETRVIEATELIMQRKASEAALSAQAALLEINQLRGAAAADVVLSTLHQRSLERHAEDLSQQGQVALDQLLFMRPVAGHARHAMPLPGLFLCGAGTHPGPGLTGLSCVLAARALLQP